MVHIYRAHEKNGNFISVSFVWNPEGRDHSGNSGIVGRIRVKYTLKKQGIRV
jgi:hypothetical protein